MLLAMLNVAARLALGAPGAMEGLPPDAGAKDDAGYAEGVVRRPLGELVVASDEADLSAGGRSDDATCSEGIRRVAVRLAAEEIRGPFPPGRDDAAWPEPGRRDPVDPGSLPARR